MKTSVIKKSLYIIIPLALIAIVVIRLKSNKEIAQQKIYQYDKEQAINIEAYTIKNENLNEQLLLSGTFEPNKETKISTEIQGKINEIFVDAGSFVKKGQMVVQIDNSLLKLQLQTIDVQIEGLEADVKRYTILANADAIQGVQLEKATLGLRSAKVQRAQLIEQINKTTIKAPFEGVVTSKLTEVGAFAAPGIPLIQVTDIALLKFTVNTPENNLRDIQVNQSYSITTDAFPEISLTGKATLIGSKANIGNSFPVQFTVNNTTDLKIKSGMFGKVILKNDNQEKGIIIPSSAIVGKANQPQVYLIKNGKSVLQVITLSKKIGNKTVVSSGLKTGDLIVSNGFINIFNGANVSVK
ncbi:MAG: efflux RND transporter periplasmic adaptor subunit [Bacteroidota bacterium]